ncbi:amino acid permease [Arthrobacter bambusae]|uniref:Amino acid transporter n=1 Tax=Arthrobacter bambusae TaxID=1338426 RepID=A0AAW8DHR9_9MICC|nr:amino acid permease [Arthrobacter bambusae]MDP9905562.1 amino acid transporter [Arthrobacter bambusae]MDQ0127356.1 amino acid transporter [Arthrobacter bambusae]MDQ0178698.1 amino acid transporter [Arthrobacter bambusae]
MTHNPLAAGSIVPGTDTDVEEYGYKQEMKRGTGKFASFAVAFAFVSIATGIFTTYGAVLNSSGPAGIWTWPIVTVGQLMVALIFGSLAARIPVTGYSYQWMSRLANPVLGWIMGWISFTFLAIVVVAVDYTIASTVLPVLLGYEGTLANAWLITSIVLALQALLVAFSTRWTERVNNFAVSAELIGMIMLVVLLIVVGAVAKELNVGNLFSTGSLPAQDYFSVGSLLHVGPWMMGTLLGAFTIVGFESAANLAEETKDPARVVPRAMWQAVLASGILGFLFLLAITMLAGDPATLAGSATPVADVINRVLGPVVGTALLVMVVVAIFACGMVILMTGVRLVWAMSRDDRFPGHAVWRKVSPRFGTPTAATGLMFVLGELILGLFAFQTDALFSLFGAATLLPAVIYAATVLLYIVKRKSLPPSKGFTLGKFEVPVIILAAVWLIFMLSVFRDASFINSWLYVAIMVAIGAVYLVFLLIRRGGPSGLAMPDLHSIDAELDADAKHSERAHRK